MAILLACTLYLHVTPAKYSTPGQVIRPICNNRVLCVDLLISDFALSIYLMLASLFIIIANLCFVISCNRQNMQGLLGSQGENFISIQAFNGLRISPPRHHPPGHLPWNLPPRIIQMDISHPDISHPDIFPGHLSP